MVRVIGLLVGLFFVLLAVLALAAQVTLTAVVAPDTPFKVEWYGEAGDSFRWWCNGEIRKNFMASEVTVDLASVEVESGLVRHEAMVPGLPAGKHSCQVSATTEYWTLLEAPDLKGEAIPIVVAAKDEPKTPIKLRLVVEVVK